MEIIQEIRQCLAQVEQPQMDKPEIMLAALKRLDALAEAAELPPKLGHYLQKRSYEKALLYVQGLDE